jgi:hypothetical protein
MKCFISSIFAVSMYAVTGDKEQCVVSLVHIMSAYVGTACNEGRCAHIDSV